jgi:hypothetical protein
MRLLVARCEVTYTAGYKSLNGVLSISALDNAAEGRWRMDG